MLQSTSSECNYQLQNLIPRSAAKPNALVLIHCSHGMRHISRKCNLALLVWLRDVQCLKRCSLRWLHTLRVSKHWQVVRREH